MGKDIIILLSNLFNRILTGKYLLCEQITESDLNNFFPTSKTIFTDSGRSAILLAIKSLGLSKDDEVIISSFNCPAVIDPIITSGVRPVLIDCNASGGINIDSLTKAINNKTKAIILTNIYGILDDRDKIKNIIGERKITIINDLSQTLLVPNLNKGFFINEDLYVFSFGPEKHIYCFGGGAVFTSNKVMLSKIKSIIPLNTINDWQLFGIMINRVKYYFTLFIYAKLIFFVVFFKKIGLILDFASSKEFGASTPSEKIFVKGFNPIQKCILSNKLVLFERFKTKNVQNYEHLKFMVNRIKNIHTLEGKIVNPLYFTIIVENSRYKLSKFLSLNSIPSVWNYIPLHLLQRYKKFSPGDYPNSNRLWKKVLSIPFRFPINITDIDKITNCLNKYQLK